MSLLLLMVLLFQARCVWLQVSYYSWVCSQSVGSGWGPVYNGLTHMARELLGHMSLHPAGTWHTDWLPREAAEACKVFILRFRTAAPLILPHSTGQSHKEKSDSRWGKMDTLLTGKVAKLHCKGPEYRGRMRNCDYFTIHHIWGPTFQLLERRDVESRCQVRPDGAKLFFHCQL